MTTFKNIDLKSFQKQCLKIFCFEIPKPLFSNGKSVVFGKPAEYFPDLEKGEKASKRHDYGNSASISPAWKNAICHFSPLSGPPLPQS